MPLSERIRIDANRPFIHSLTARIITAILLLLITLYVTSKTNSIHASQLNKGNPTDIKHSYAKDKGEKNVNKNITVSQSETYYIYGR